MYLKTAWITKLLVLSVSAGSRVTSRMGSPMKALMLAKSKRSLPNGYTNGIIAVNISDPEKKY